MIESGSEKMPIYGWLVDPSTLRREQEQGMECWTPLKPCTFANEIHIDIDNDKICGSSLLRPLRCTWRGVIRTLRGKKNGRDRLRHGSNSNGNISVSTKESDLDSVNSAGGVVKSLRKSSWRPFTKPSVINVVETVSYHQDGRAIDFECVMADVLVLSTPIFPECVSHPSFVSRSVNASSKVPADKKERKGTFVDPWSMAKRGDVMGLRELDAQYDIDWTARDRFDSPPIYYACHSGAVANMESVRFLLHVWPHPTLPEDLLARCRKNAINSQVVRMLDNVSVLHDVYLSDVDVNSDVSSSSCSRTELSAWYDMFDTDDNVGDLEDY